MPAQEHEEFINYRIRKILASKALRSMRKMVNDIEHEELTDKKLLQTLCAVLLAVILAAAIFVYQLA